MNKLFWKMALLNLRRNKRRSLATGSAIAAGFLGLTLLGSYIYGLQMGLQANMVYMNLQGHIQIHKTDSYRKFAIAPKKYLIDPNLDSALTKALAPFADRIEFQGHFLTGSGLVISGDRSQPFLATAYDQETLTKARQHPFVKEWGQMIVSQKDIMGVASLPDSVSDGISLTPRLAEVLNLPAGAEALGQPLQLATQTLDRDLNAANAQLATFHTTGIELAEDTSIRMPLNLLQSLLATDGYQWRSLYLKPGVNVRNLQSQMTASFHEQNLPFEVLRFDQEGLGDFYLGSISFLFVMGCFFVALICTMVALSIVNSLTLGILERTKEIGTLKALGFSRGQIVGLFVRESLWLTLMSLCVGLILSLIVSSVMNSFDIRFNPPNIEGDIRLTLMPNGWLNLLFSFSLILITFLTAAWVATKKLKASAVYLLSDAM